MLFEVWKDKTSLMGTDNISAIYDEKTLKDMQKAGHFFKLNGKRAAVSTVIKYITENKKDSEEK